MTTAPLFQRCVYIGAPDEKVWDALVNPEVVRLYYLCPMRLIELKIGGQILYGSATDTFITGQILELEPVKKLVHTFAFVPDMHGTNVENDPATRVTYDLTAMGEMCRLDLVHDGFAERNQTYYDITGGWDAILSSLKTVLETGKQLPWPKHPS